MVDADERVLVEIDRQRFPWVHRLEVGGIMFDRPRLIRMDQLTLDMQLSQHLLVDGESYESRVGLVEAPKYVGAMATHSLPSI